MNHKIKQLIRVAKTKMLESHDPIHDILHVERVVKNTKKLCQELRLSSEQTEALVIAASWHDVSRIITKKTSLIVMPFFDDLISAIMLWYYTFTFGLLGTSAGLATKLITCKSLGTGAIFTRFLMKKEDRLLIDVLKDADFMDALSQERMEKLIILAESSWLYHHGYKTVLRWFVTSAKLKMKTEAARRHVEELLCLFLAWISEQEMYAWHVEQFGERWAKNMLARGEELLDQIILLNMESALAVS